MNILYDLTSIQRCRNDGIFHGGSEYSKVVFYKLCKLLPSDTSLEVLYNPKYYIEDIILEICKEKGVKIILCYNHKDINKVLAAKRYDIFYAALPYSYGDLVIPPETKFIYTVHGLRALECPVDKYRLKYKKFNLKEIIKHYLYLFFPNIMEKRRYNKEIKKIKRLFSVSKNQIIITVSNHSKYSIAYFFPKLDITNIRVLYSPLKECEFDDKKTTNVIKSYSLEPHKYILLICGHRNEKGAYRACRVLNKLISEHGRMPENIKVIVLGVTHSTSYRNLTKNNSKFIFQGYVPAEDLEALYKNAHLFLYPTLNEGFGYPPLEAMKYGTLCACSANSSITEVCGDSVIYFNPHDEIEMSNRILQSFDEEIRREKSKLVSIRYKQVTEKQKSDLDILVENIILNK